MLTEQNIFSVKQSLVLNGHSVGEKTDLFK